MLKSTDGTDIIALKEYCYGKIINMGIIDWERAIYREYEDDAQYRWVKPLFDKIWAKLD